MLLCIAYHFSLEFVSFESFIEVIDPERPVTFSGCYGSEPVHKNVREEGGLLLNSFLGFRWLTHWGCR